MALLADISPRRAIVLMLAIAAVLTGGTWIAVKLTTDHLINQDARANARGWALYLAENVTDLRQIAAGEQPSVASMTFLEKTRKASQLFRYEIFNRYGFSQFVVDREKTGPIDIAEFNAQAARAVATKQIIVDVSAGKNADQPAFFARAYVPVIVDGQPIATVAAYVDETEQRANFRNTFLIATLSLSGLTLVAFGLPAIAWYWRTLEKQQADRRIRFLAHHDPLTGLANRARLIERLDSVLAKLSALDGYIAVHFIDLDHFKEVNDTFGHDGGDFLLNTLGQRLTSLTRIEDLVARLGGDEFVVVQTGVGRKEDVEAFARRIASIMCEPMTFREQELKTNVTIGIAIAPTDGKTSERLLKSADLALYNGKTAGRNCIRLFTPEMDEAFQAHLRLEKLVRHAVANDGFILHYQPIVEISHKRLVGFEALVRLPAKDGTLIPPATFIPVAEEIHLIDKIGAWILREGCRTATRWPDNLSIAINLSPSQFESGTIVTLVADALKDAGLDPHRLELEVTETLLLGNNETTMKQLRQLKALGVAIVMDDFGTGYSSLSYLWQFPFDKIKIDRSFMQNFEAAGRDVEAVVKSIIALGRELRMRVTVEGVETKSQTDFLYDADADQVQGFYFGRPMPASEISADIIKDFSKTLPLPTPRAEETRRAAKPSA